MLHTSSNTNAFPSGSVLFSDVSPSRISYHRAQTTAGVVSRDSWASNTPSDVSFESTEMGHDNPEDEIDEFLDTVSSIVVPSFSNDAIFGSTSPRKRGTSVSSSRSRASLDSVRSSSVGTSSTPLTPASVKERTPTTTINDFKLTPPRPRMVRLASDEIAFSRKSSALEEASKRSISKAATKSDRNSVSSNTSNRDGLMLAMAQLEKELQRTMVTLSSPLASPVPSFSKASSRSKSGRSRRPSTADGASPSGSLSRKPQPLFSVASPSRLQIPRFDSESWGDSLLREIDAAAPSSARRLSTKGPVLRPTSQMSVSSTTSNCSHHQAEDLDSDSVSIPSLVFDGRKSASSSTSSTTSSTASQPHVREFVTGGKGSRPDHYFASGHNGGSKFATVNNRSPGVKPSFYANKNAARSVPSLSALPPREPLPPLPPMPSTIKSSGDIYVPRKSLHLPVNPPRSSSSPVLRPRTATTSVVHEIQQKPLPSVPAVIPSTAELLPASSMQTRAKRAMSLRRLFT